MFDTFKMTKSRWAKKNYKKKLSQIIKIEEKFLFVKLQNISFGSFLCWWNIYNSGRQYSVWE